MRSFLVTMILGFASVVFAESPPPSKAVESTCRLTLYSDVAILGTVAALEKETPEIEAAPGLKKAHQVARIKIDTGFTGIAGLTHLRIGYVTTDAKERPRNAPATLPGIPALEVGQQRLFFLRKLPGNNQILLLNGAPLVDVATPSGKQQLEQARKTSTVMADSMKALTSPVAEDRCYAALVMLAKYRGVSNSKIDFLRPEVAVPAEESRLILRGLLDGDWSKSEANAPTVFMAPAMLGLSAKDGWVPPQLKIGENSGPTLQRAFADWRAGPGKNYVVKRYQLRGN